MNIDPTQFLFVEKYRPKTIDDCILPMSLKKTFKDMVAKGQPQNILLAGTAGTGKTTVARALCSEFGVDVLTINCSEDGNIDTLRNKIRQFASTVSFSDAKKTVILDEFDYSNCIDDTESVLMINGDYVKLQDLEIGIEYEIISFNTITREFEKDKAYRSTSGVKEVYCIEFEDGSSVNVTDDHILICQDSYGNIVEKCIKDGLEDVFVIALK